jgi:hypothetical protein
MKNMPNTIDETVRKMMTEPGEIALRHAFLELEDADLALLREVKLRLAERQHVFSDSFYQYLLQFPSLSALLMDSAAISRLKNRQAVYFTGIAGGEYGSDYVRDRLRVGIVHQRIGLEPQWYIGAYRKYLSELAAEVRKLAKRSQVAAKEIGELAANSVMVSDKAGRLLADMIPAIRKTSDLVQEITAASEEQTVGLAQISTAMSQLNQATQQNASASEELAATAEAAFTLDRNDGDLR